MGLLLVLKRSGGPRLCNETLSAVLLADLMGFAGLKTVCSPIFVKCSPFSIGTAGTKPPAGSNALYSSEISSASYSAKAIAD